MDQKILKIASNLENFYSIKNYTHFKSLKSMPCGDEIKVYLVVKKGKINNFKYTTDSCIYCQASASLLSRVLLNTNIDKVEQLFELLSKSFVKNKYKLDKKWKKFSMIINKSNVSRKNCLLLPLKATLKALKNSC